MVTFHWDEAKNQKNREKHGISSELASLVFADPLSVSRNDNTKGNEERFQIIGQVFRESSCFGGLHDQGTRRRRSDSLDFSSEGNVGRKEAV